MGLLKCVVFVTFYIQAKTCVLDGVGARDQDQLSGRRIELEEYIPGPADNTTQSTKTSTTATTPKTPSPNRTLPTRISLTDGCDYMAYYCLQAYKTGKLCGRTVYHEYHNFTNYCMLDFVNCMEGYEVWQIAYMGECWKVLTLKDYDRFEYFGDYFFEQTYVIQE